MPINEKQCAAVTCFAAGHAANRKAGGVGVNPLRLSGGICTCFLHQKSPVISGLFFCLKDVMAFYGDGAAVPPLAFSSTIKDMKALLHNA